MLVYTFLLLLHFTSSSYSCTFLFFLSIIELFGNHSERTPARSHTLSLPLALFLPIRFSSAPSNYNNNNKNTSRLETTHNMWKIDQRRRFFIFLLSSSTRKYTNYAFTHTFTNIPRKKRRETREPKLLRAVACARENHSKILVRPFFAVANSFRSFLLINHLHLERSTSTERQGAPNAHHPEKEQSSTLISSVENLHSFEHFAPW